MNIDGMIGKPIAITALWLLLLLTAIWAVSTSHHVRTTTNQLHLLVQEFNSLSQQKNHLVAELNTFGGYVRLEDVARKRFSLENAAMQSVVKVAYE